MAGSQSPTRLELALTIITSWTENSLTPDRQVSINLELTLEPPQNELQALITSVETG